MQAKMKTYFIFSLLTFLSGVHVFAQAPPSSNENFVRTEVIRKSGITTEAQITALPVGKDKAVNYTYFDGLGRPLQSNQLKASPASKDIIRPYVYDAFGREAKKYLPYTRTTNNGVLQSGALTEQAGFITQQATKSLMTDGPIQRYCLTACL
ncbi:MAG: DUF6443 domain-containing protein [Bacteroidota bacterium]|nr:DUF6443 domain-containing protein [Bacteroidota bacterium]MDQ3536740.1 DUF6443 domain-containing protein [Bacteroidota bacterium]